MEHCDVAIVGAGPYGLSIAAHLQRLSVSFRIFGTPMGFWKSHMPPGMHLKSEGFASSLYDPEAELPLRAYCAARKIPYADLGLPVPLEVFTEYGLEFQRTFVPQMEDVKVEHVEPVEGGFQVRLASGEVLAASRVIVAVGLAYYTWMPEMLSALPAEFVSHSSAHGPVEQFRGRDVAIVGAGASAVDLAAVLHEAGARVEVLARGPEFRFQQPPLNSSKSFLERFVNPVTGIGNGWKLWLCCNLPLLFRKMPEKFRIDRVRRTLGPAPCWFTRELVEGKVGLHTNVALRSAEVAEGKVRLAYEGPEGPKALVADHVIAATGYRPDVGRIAFLDEAVQARIARVGDSPALSSHFESSVPGLYFVGISAAHTFGPLLRFAFGAGFTAPRIAQHLARTATKDSFLNASVPVAAGAAQG